MILVVNTNTNTCRMYHYHKHPAQLTLYKEIKHLETKLKNKDLTADKPGHYKSRESTRGTYSPHLAAKEIEIDQFSREIANVLNHERTENELEKLIVIAPPHMTGLLFQHLNKHVKNLITHHIQKDLLHLPDHDLLDYLQVNTQYQE